MDAKNSGTQDLKNSRSLSKALQKACEKSGAMVSQVLTHKTTVMVLLDAGWAVLRANPDLCTWSADFVLDILDPVPAADYLAERLGGQSESSEMRRPIEIGIFAK